MPDKDDTKQDLPEKILVPVSRWGSWRCVICGAKGSGAIWAWAHVAIERERARKAREAEGRG